MSNLIAVAALSTAGVLTGLGGAAEPAGATQAGTTGTIKSFATTYSSPSNQSVAVHHLQAGTEVDTLCFREGQVLNGNPLWFIINEDGQSAYVHRDLIAPPAELPHC
jgi:hypothetical protein